MSTRPECGIASRGEGVLARLTRLDPAQRAAVGAALNARRLRGHECVARGLRALGVTHVYAMPGLPTDETIGACVRVGLKTTGTRHQQAAVMMAAAHNYVAGRLVSVAVVSAGVAVANAITGVSVAQQNGWPVLLLAGAVDCSIHGDAAFMAFDGMSTLAGLAKACFRVNSADQLESVLADAVRTAVVGRPGAVYVELPEDCLAACAVPASKGADVTWPAVAPEHCDPVALQQAVELLAGAQRPLVVFGKGVRWDDAYSTLRDLVEQLPAPFIASPMGRGLLSDCHPLARTADQTHLLGAADVLLVAGARLNWTFRHGAGISPGARIIQIDCATEAFDEGPPRAVTLCGTAAAILPPLLEGVRKRRAVGAHRPSAHWPPAPTVFTVGSVPGGAASRRPAPGELAAVLARLLPPDAVVVLDGNVTLLAAQQHIAARTPLSRLTPGTSGCMGTGLPFALGAAQASPGRPVILVTGDMALGLNFFEFETAVRHEVPVVVVLANNDGPSGARRQHKVMPEACDQPVLVYQDGLRYDEMARQLGAYAEYADTLDALPAALERALACGRPALIQIQVDQLES